MNASWFRFSLWIAPVMVMAGCGKSDVAGPGGFPPVQVVAVAARQQQVVESLSLVGTLAANESVEITSETDGVIQEIPFLEGERVEEGRLLVRLDESKLAAAVAEAEANFKLSAATYERSRQLFRDRLISQQEFDQAAATFEFNQAALDLKKRQLKDTRIYAPFEGVVGARQVSPGQVISKNQTITWLVDLDPIKVEVDVPERFLGQLRVGQSIELRVAAFPGREFQGTVFFISPFVDPATRTALVKAEIPNESLELKPGMFANLDLTLKIRNEAIVIPESAITLSGDRATVFTITSSNTAALREVQIGVRMPGHVEIARGLSRDEKVVVEGLQKLRPGAPVRISSRDYAGPDRAGEVATEIERTNRLSP